MGTRAFQFQWKRPLASCARTRGTRVITQSRRRTTCVRGTRGGGRQRGEGYRDAAAVIAENFTRVDFKRGARVNHVNPLEMLPCRGQR